MIPEPGSLLLLGAGGLALMLSLRRRQSGSASSIIQSEDTHPPEQPIARLVVAAQEHSRHARSHRIRHTGCVRELDLDRRNNGRHGGVRTPPRCRWLRSWLLAIPFLIYSTSFRAGPLLIAALTLHLLVLQRDRTGVDGSGLTMLLGGRLVGTIPAALLLAWLPAESMKLLLGFVLLAGAIMGAAHGGGHPTRAALFGAGTASGFMATVAALGGPPVALIYQRAPGKRLRGTLAAYFIVGTILSLAALAAVGRFGTNELRLSLVLIPGTVLGYLVSHRAAAFLDTGHTAQPCSRCTLAAVRRIATVLL